MSSEGDMAHETWRVFRIMAEFVEGFDELNKLGPAVSIFGSARTKPGDPCYTLAEQTAAAVVRANMAVITGGGGGIMEAANKGALEAGGQSVGRSHWWSRGRDRQGDESGGCGEPAHYPLRTATDS